jgi:hypothetical protein
VVAGAAVSAGEPLDRLTTSRTAASTTITSSVTSGPRDLICALLGGWVASKQFYAAARQTAPSNTPNMMLRTN